MKSILVFLAVALCARVTFAVDVLDADNNDRIINGSATDIRRHPYQLSFRIRGRHICGASIITSTRGLTAAHCFNGHHPVTLYSILAGVSRLSNAQKGQVRPLTRIIRHPGFNNIRHRNDIAVFWFERPLPFGQTIAAIRLPKINAEIPPFGNVTGWGITQPNNLTSLPDTLQHTLKTKIGNHFCASLYNGINQITNQMFCTHQGDARIDACTGDDGGAYESGRYIYGIISWGHRCAHPMFPRVYTRVSSYLDWIRTNANMTAVV